MELQSQELQDLTKEQKIWILYISTILHLCLFLWLLIFEGDGGLQKRTLSGITSAVDFFTVLKEKMYLNRENLIFVQACLWNVGRRDLHRKCVEFAKSSDKILHFYCPKDTPGMYTSIYDTSIPKIIAINEEMFTRGSMVILHLIQE